MSQRQHPFKKLYNNVAVCGGEKIPTQDEFLNEWRTTRKKTLLWYSSSKMIIPTKATLETESATPFGAWLSERYGSQKGIWGKAAWFAAEILKGKSAPRVSDRDSIWDIIVGTPNRDDEIAFVCGKFGPQ